MGRLPSTGQGTLGPRSLRRSRCANQLITDRVRRRTKSPAMPAEIDADHQLPPNAAPMKSGHARPTAIARPVSTKNRCLITASFTRTLFLIRARDGLYSSDASCFARRTSLPTHHSDDVRLGTVPPCSGRREAKHFGLRERGIHQRQRSLRSPRRLGPRLGSCVQDRRRRDNASRFVSASSRRSCSSHGSFRSCCGRVPRPASIFRCVTTRWHVRRCR